MYLQIFQGLANLGWPLLWMCVPRVSNSPPGISRLSWEGLSRGYGAGKRERVEN